MRIGWKESGGSDTRQYKLKGPVFPDQDRSRKEDCSPREIFVSSIACLLSFDPIPAAFGVVRPANQKTELYFIRHVFVSSNV